MDKDAYAQSLVWNKHVRHWLECVSKGVNIDHQTIATSDGWVLIGRYASGKESAWVQAARYKHLHPNLETNVVGTPDKEWKAEVWVRVKKEVLTS